MSERLKYVLLAALLAVAVTLSVLSARTVQRENDGSAGFALTSAGDAASAADFTLAEAQTGRPVGLLAAARAHPVVLDFWATWCGPCRAELPLVSDVARKYQGRVTFYGVDSSDRPADILAFSRALHVPFPTLVDAHQQASEAYGASTSIPRLVLVDTQGRVRLLTAGYDPQADVEGDLGRDLDTLLAGN